MVPNFWAAPDTGIGYQVQVEIPPYQMNSADEIVAHCKSGMRSAKAVDFLKQAGFKKVKNMKGGILAWSDKVDPRVPKY